MALTPDEVRAILDRHTWQPGEREQVLDDLAERAAVDDAPRWPRAAEVKRAAEQPEPARNPKRDRSAAMTNDWSAYIDRRIRRSQQAHEKTLLGAISDVLHDERQAHRREVETLRAKLDEATARLDRLEQVERSATPPHLRAV